jgi:Leucine-rich repeat (LRR) protein
VQHLEKFTNLVSLVLDNNEVEDLNDMPVLPNLETLWVNNNRIADLESLLSVLEKNFPKLRYLSILKNPACPNEFTFHDTDDYQRYRFYVLWRLKNLKFLDSKEVTPVERKEADKRGKFCKVVVPDYNQIQKQAMDTGSPQMEAMPQKVLEPGDSKQPSSYFGYTKHVYTGKHSEGNRFIKNNDL